MTNIPLTQNTWSKNWPIIGQKIGLLHSRITANAKTGAALSQTAQAEIPVPSNMELGLTQKFTSKPQLHVKILYICYKYNPAAKIAMKLIQ